MSEARSEIRDGMQIEWDAAIRMDDGIVLRADVFSPAALRTSRGVRRSPPR